MIGGSSVYQEAMTSSLCEKVYLTRILADIECDTFISPIGDEFILDPDHVIEVSKFSFVGRRLSLTNTVTTRDVRRMVFRMSFMCTFESSMFYEEGYVTCKVSAEPSADREAVTSSALWLCW